jgi:hypothetical protein
LENEIRKKNDERLAKILQEQEKVKHDNLNLTNPEKSSITAKSSVRIQNPYELEELPDIDIMKNNSRLYQDQSNQNKQVNRKR